MILRDPVHGLVAFEGEVEPVIEALLRTREVQRLRRVQQLGLTSLVFPGAEHSRFSHALGTAHVMARLIDSLRPRQGDLPKEQRLEGSICREAVAAALLHDVGHGPFSHLFEDVLEGSRKHESWTIEVVRNDATDVHRALEGLHKGMAERVAALLQGTHPVRWLGRAISGRLDVDRCDYLLRDSLMTGVAYGLYDLDWLMRALSFREVLGEWVLAIEGRKGLPPIEAYFLGRHFMYRQVYHHKATRAAECLIRASFSRLAELVRDGNPPGSTPDAIRDAVLGRPLELGAYLELDDSVLLHCFAEWEREHDRLLADFSARLRHRSLPKTMPLPESMSKEGWRALQDVAADVVQTHGIRSDLSVFLDVAQDEPFPEPATPGPDDLWVTLSHQPMRRLGEVSFALGHLRNRVHTSPRLIFPAEMREAVVKRVGERLRRSEHGA